MKILSSADWHINLHKKKIPYNWQLQRFNQMFERMHSLEAECDIHVIAGDLFDDYPDPDEICLLLSYLNRVTIPTIVIPGNHEATSKGKTFWSHFKMDGTITNPQVHIFTENDRIELLGQGFCLFPYGSVQTKQLPPFHEGDILVTHIRGEVPPHITPEFDFELLRSWKLILLGDLHFNHRYKNFPAYYPGSPLNTTFDRVDNRKYGVDIIDLRSTEDYSVTFVDLDLPKLIRRTVSSEEEMVEDTKNHIIYELTGSIDQLAKIKNSKLLDKKLVEKPSDTAVLDFKGKKIVEQLAMYLEYMKVEDSAGVISTFKELGVVEQ